MSIRERLGGRQEKIAEQKLGGSMCTYVYSCIYVGLLVGQWWGREKKGGDIPP